MKAINILFGKIIWFNNVKTRGRYYVTSSNKVSRLETLFLLLLMYYSKLLQQRIYQVIIIYRDTEMNAIERRSFLYFPFKLRATFVLTIVTFCLFTNNPTCFFVLKPTRCTDFTNLFCHETLHVSDSSSVHHQEFIHCTLSSGICHTGL